jgi:hypothetical protein
VNRFRIGFAITGFVLALLSVALDDHRLAWIAIAFLAGSLVFRLALRKEKNRTQEGEDQL